MGSRCFIHLPRLALVGLAVEHLAPARNPSVKGVSVLDEAGDVGEVVPDGGEVAWAAERLGPQS